MQSLNPQIDLLGRLISATETRQKVISHNLANVNTPEYRRLEVDFESQLSAELARGDSGGSMPVQATIRESTGRTARADGNTVDVDQEIGELNKNALLQQMYLQLLGTELSQMRLAIEGS
jgi:flagellar basal-body rod protein FlgB